MKRTLPYLLFAALTLLVFWKFLFLGGTMYSIELLEAYLDRPVQSPPAWFAAERPRARVTDSILTLPAHFRDYNEGLHEGELRLWNPSLFCGYPSYYSPMLQPFYPPHLLLHRLFSPGTAYGLSLLLHFFFAGCTMYGLLGALGRTGIAATAGALAWMLFGYTALWTNASILLGVGVFAPLALRWIVEGLERKDLSRAVPAALAMGMAILGSHPQHALHVFLFLLAWIALAWARDRTRFEPRFGALFAVLAVGVGLAAILTRLDSLTNGYRRVAREFDAVYDAPLEVGGQLAGLVAGKILVPGRPVLHYELAVYAGLTVTALAVLGAVRGRREPMTRFATVFGAGCLVAAFFLPAAKLLSWVPILNLSPPSRWIYVFGFCLAILAARGVEAFATDGRRVAWICGALAAALLLACLKGTGSFRLGNGAAIDTLIGFGLVTLAAAVAAKRPRPGLALCLGALLYELVPPFMYHCHPSDPAALEEVPEAVKFVRQNATGPFRAAGGLGSLHSTDTYIFTPEFTGANNLLAIYGLELVAGFDAIAPAPVVRFCSAAGAEILPHGRAIVLTNYDSPLLDLPGLRYIFMPFNIDMPKHFTQVGKWGKNRLYENTRALPRAWMVSRVRAAASEEEAVRLIREPGFNPREEVILDGAPGAAGGPVTSTIGWKRGSSDRVVLDVDASSDGVLVLTDTYDPGWEATVDGRPVEIHKADVAFRAVRVAQGRHEVEFRFRPGSARWGLVISGLFALGCLAFSLRRRRAA